MKKQPYEKEYIKTLKKMDDRTLCAYMIGYIKKAGELLEGLASVLDEIKLTHGLLLQKLSKEKK